jgi:hypothetical protein
MSEKPILFISHSSKDGHIANVLKEQLEAVLDIEVFETSHFKAIEGGEEWFKVITQKLDKAKALLVLASYNSRFSQWVHWEIGYFYKKSKDASQSQSIYVATIADEQSFNTVQVTQMKSFNDANEAMFLLETIGKYLGFNLNITNYQKAVDEILKIVPVHISDDSAKEKLRDYLKLDYKAGRWIEYDELDRTLHIPLGTSKTWIKQIIQEDKMDLQVIKPEDESEEGIRLNGVIRLGYFPDGWDDPLGNY